MVRLRTEADRVEVTSSPGVASKAAALLFLAAALFGLGWLVTSLGRSETRHFTCDRSSGSCAVQSGDDVSLIKLASIRAVTIIEHEVHRFATDHQLVVVLDDGSNRAIGRDAIQPSSVADYRRAASEIRGFLEGNAPTIKVGYTWRASWMESWPAIALTGGGLLAGLWLLAGWRRRHAVADKAAGTVHWTSTGPLRRSRERRLPFAEIHGVARAGRGPRQRLELKLAKGKRLRLLDGPAHALADAEKALAALLPKAPPPPPPSPPRDEKARKVVGTPAKGG